MNHGTAGRTDRRGVSVRRGCAHRTVAGDAAGRSRTNRDSQGALARAPILRDVIRERKGSRSTGGYIDRVAGGGPNDSPTSAYRPAMSHGPSGRTDRGGVVAIIPWANRSVAGNGAGGSRINRDSQGAL